MLDHAVTAVRLDGDWIVLDDQGAKRFVPPALIDARQAAAPASF